MSAVVIRTTKKKNKKWESVEKKKKKIYNMPENSNLENPLYRIIRALSPVPSHLAEFYSHKEWCLALVICFVMERPAPPPPLDYTVDYVNVAETRGHAN